MLLLGYTYVCTCQEREDSLSLSCAGECLEGFPVNFSEVLQGRRHLTEQCTQLAQCQQS